MANKPNKTQETAASVDKFLAKVKPAAKQADCRALCELMARVSGEPARMWGPSIVGFGTRHYRYESGREGDTLVIGFSPRAQALVLYGVGGEARAEGVAALGKVKMGKGCVYVKTLADLDLKKLEALIKRSL
jgi:Domain of unknown function (DU1801)